MHPRMLMFYDCLHDLSIIAVLNNLYYVVDATRIKCSSRLMMCDGYRAFVNAGRNNELSLFHTYRMYSIYIQNVELCMFAIEYDFILAIPKGWTIKR